VFEAAEPASDTNTNPGTTDKKILVLSAGPNGEIETEGTSSTPVGDDVIAVFGGST